MALPSWSQANDEDHKEVSVCRNGQDGRIHELPYMGGTGLYGGDHFSLLIVLPGNNNKLAALEQKLGEIDLKQLFDKKKRNTEVAFVLPKFKISQTIPLTELLKKIDMTDMF